MSGDFDQDSVDSAGVLSAPIKLESSLISMLNFARIAKPKRWNGLFRKSDQGRCSVTILRRSLTLVSVLPDNLAVVRILTTLVVVN